MKKDIYAKKCQCNAVTVEYINDAGEQINISMKLKLFRETFPGVRLASGLYSNCNHCVNNWGIDLCGCGSGAKFGKCKNNMNACAEPAQQLDKQKTYMLWN